MIIKITGQENEGVHSSASVIFSGSDYGWQEENEGCDTKEWIEKFWRIKKIPLQTLHATLGIVQQWGNGHLRKHMVLTSIYW